MFKNISLELIDYQNKDNFPNEVNSLVEFIYEEIDSKVYKNNKELITKSNHVKKLVSTINKRFNLNIQLDSELGVLTPAAIIPFLSDSVLNSKSLNGLDISFFKNLFSGVNIYKHLNSIIKEREELYKKIHNKKGYVDLKNARVGGYLSSVKHTLILNFFILKELDISSKEFTAILVHEIGHAFTGLETHHNLTTFNSTILDTLDKINKNKENVIDYRFKSYFTEKEISEAELGSKNGRIDFYSKIANKYIEQLNSQLLNAKYDETNYENMSDSFAVRFNLGKDLVSGLHKLNSLSGSVVSNSKTLYFSMYMIEVILLLLVLCTTGIVGLMIGSFILIHMFTSNTDMTYDFPVDRYNRIKNGIINNLKNKDLPKQLTKDLLDQYYFIDEIIKSSDYFKGVIPLLGEYIVPRKINDNYYIQLQQNIENNLNSVLFVKSAHLRTL